MHLYIYLLHLLIVSKKHATFLSVPSKRSCFFLFDLSNFYGTVYFHIIRYMRFYIIISSCERDVLKSVFKLLEKPLQWKNISYYIIPNYILYQATLLYHTPHTLLSHQVYTLNIGRFKIRKKSFEGVEKNQK